MGNYTGVIPGQDLSNLFLGVIEDIPGSYFVSSGESQSIFLPKSGTYTLVYQGIGEGPTTISVSNFSNDVVLPLATYSDISTQFGTQASLVIENNPEEATILIDEDGNGSFDSFSKPDTYGRTITDMVADMRVVASDMQTARSNYSHKLPLYESRINSNLDYLERTYLTFLSSSHTRQLFTAVADLEGYITSISSGPARIRWTNSRNLKALLKEIKEEVDFVETQEGSGTGDGGNSSQTEPPPDTGEYYTDGDQWELEL